MIDFEKARDPQTKSFPLVWPFYWCCGPASLSRTSANYEAGLGADGLYFFLTKKRINNNAFYFLDVCSILFAVFLMLEDMLNM